MTGFGACSLALRALHERIARPSRVENDRLHPVAHQAWDAREYRVSTEAATDGGVEAIAVAVDRVGGGGDARTARFASFVSRFRPDAAAREAYAAHTKRAHDGNVEEFRLFFEIDERAAASAPRAGDRRRAAPGLVHCTLPTRVRAPTPRSHVDGPFMLSASRGVL